MGKNLDDFVDKLNEKEFEDKNVSNNTIIDRTKKKIRKFRIIVYIKSIAAILVFSIIASAFIPNTPVNAFCKRVFSFIPGVGVVQTDEGKGVISALKESVTQNEGREHITIESAYVQNGYLIVKAKTNIGLSDSADMSKELLKFYAGELNPKIYLQNNGEWIQPASMQITGASPDTGVYKLQAQFKLPEEINKESEFNFSMEGFDPNIKIVLNEVISSTEISELGYNGTLGDIHVFADFERKEDTIQVMLSTVAPKEYKNIRFKLFDDEQEMFKSVYIIDSRGNEYKSDRQQEEENDADFNVFYFNVPTEAKGLKLIIPQALYNRRFDDEMYKVKIPSVNEVVNVNKRFHIGESDVTLESVEFISKGSEILPETFKNFDSLKINLKAVNTVRGKEKVIRVLPIFLVRQNIFEGYNMIGQSIYEEKKNFSDQSRYAIGVFNGMENTKGIKLIFEIEFAYIKGTEIVLE